MIPAKYWPLAEYADERWLDDWGGMGAAAAVRVGVGGNGEAAATAVAPPPGMSSVPSTSQLSIFGNTGTRKPSKQDDEKSGRKKRQHASNIDHVICTESENAFFSVTGARIL